MTYVVTALLGLAALNVVWNVYATLRGLSAMLPLPDNPAAPTYWPKVSMIIPACNEAATLEAATRAKLETDYPNLEVVVVDDRSTDGTSRIAEKLGESDPRFRVVHVAELPPGWLGKVHALHVGVGAASGDWLLFSDADVHIGPGVLRRVIAEAVRRDSEVVVMAAQILSSTFTLDVIFSTFMRMLVVGGRLWKVSDPKSRVAVGGGVFNLAKRSAFERTPGFEYLRLEIADDVAFGQMMKRAGARSILFDAGDGVRLHFYQSVREMMLGLEKNGYAVFGGLRPGRLLLMVGLILYLELAPLAALALPSLPARIAGGLMLAGLVLCQVLVARAGRRAIWSALIPGVGAVMLMFFAVRSAILAHLRGGILWRGTLYPLEALRSGQRLELF